MTINQFSKLFWRILIWISINNISLAAKHGILSLDGVADRVLLASVELDSIYVLFIEVGIGHAAVVALAQVCFKPALLLLGVDGPKSHWPYDSESLLHILALCEE